MFKTEASRERWTLVCALAAVLISLIAAREGHLQVKSSDRAVDVAERARQDAVAEADRQRRDAKETLDQQRKDAAAALEAQTKLANRSVVLARQSADAAAKANEIAVAAMRQGQRPWIGPDVKTPILTGPIFIDDKGFMRANYQMTAVNYGGFGANNIIFWAQLYVAQDIKTIWDRADYACVQATGNPKMGRVMFPGQERIMTNPWPALVMDVIRNKDANPPQKEFQVYLLTCIGYRDQFGTPHHTGTIFRSVNPNTSDSLLFELSPNQVIPVEWREWYSFLN